MQVRFGTGLGERLLHVPVTDLAVLQRGHGEERYRQRAALAGAARLGVAAVFVVPTLWACLKYVIATRSLDGLPLAMLEGAVAYAVDLAGYALTNPVQALLFMCISWAAWRFAFR